MLDESIFQVLLVHLVEKDLKNIAELRMLGHSPTTSRRAFYS